MSNIKATISTTMAVSFLPTCLFAHAGMFDRYLEYSVSARALFYTTLFVQLILSAFSFGLLRKTRPFRVMRVICWHWSKKWFYSLFFLLLIPFVTLTLVDMDYVLMWLISGGSLLFIMFYYVICSFKLFVTKKRKPSSRGLYITIIVSIQQMIGYVVYLLAYKTNLMRHLFNYTDDEYQIGNYWVYPKTYILEKHIEGYVSMFIVLLCCSVFVLICAVIKSWWDNRKDKRTLTSLET